MMLPSWYKTFFTFEPEERKENLKIYIKKAYKPSWAKHLLDESHFKLHGFVPFQPIIQMNGRVSNLVFRSPVALLKVVDSPLFILAGDINLKNKVSITIPESVDGIVYGRRWAIDMSRWSLDHKLKARDAALRALSGFDCRSKEFHPTDTGVRLTQQLCSTNYDHIGFAPFVEYGRLEGDREELQARWIHAFGFPTMIFNERSSGELVITSSALRHDTSVLFEVLKNSQSIRGNEPQGWTG